MGRRSSWDLEQQLLEGLSIDPTTQCWLWRTGRRYGKLAYNYKTISTHRVSAYLYLELPLEDKRLVLHKCKNKLCCNPEHLYVGNQSDNIRDAVRDGTHNESRKTHCPRGHEYNSSNTLRWRNHRYCRACSNLRTKQKRLMEKMNERNS